MLFLKNLGNGKVNFYSSEKGERGEVVKALTFTVPNSFFMKKQGSANKKWDGKINFVDYSDFTFPITLLNFVLEHCDIVELPYTLKGFEPHPYINKTPISDKMRPYQVEAIKAVLEKQWGIIKIPTRAGKTFIASEIIRILFTDEAAKNCLFIVDTQLLFNQAVEDISNYLGKKVGTMQGENINIQPITIATIQTIQSIKRSKDKKKRETLANFLDSIDLLFVDECHEYSSLDRVAFIESLTRPKFRIFMSASPFRSEAELGNVNLQKISGQIIIDIPEQRLKEEGYLSKDMIVLISIDHSKNRSIKLKAKDTYDTYVKDTITQNSHRNGVINRIIKVCHELERKTLVLFQFKEHGASLVEHSGFANIIDGSDSLEDRTFFIKRFLKSRGGTLFASDILKKGVTLPETEIMINVAGGKEQSGIIQKKGRVLGVTKDKKRSLIIDFLDISKYFSEHSLSRLEVYEDSVGEDYIFILDSEDEDFEETLSGIIVEWFNEENE